MRLAVVVTGLLILSAHARVAGANQCNAYTEQPSVADVPLGCPMVFAVPPGFSFTPIVNVTHYDPQTGTPTTITVSGDVTRVADIEVPVEEYHYEGCELYDTGPHPWTYNQYEVALHDVEIGELETTFWGTRPKIVAAGPCPEFASPGISCADPIMTCDDPPYGDPVNDDDDDHRKTVAGCTATPGTSGAASLLLVGLAALRRRRRV